MLLQTSGMTTLKVGVAMQSTFSNMEFEVDISTTVDAFKKMFLEKEPLADPDDIRLIFYGEELKMGQKNKPEKNLLSGYGIKAGATDTILLVWENAEKAKNPDPKKKK